MTTPVSWHYSWRWHRLSHNAKNKFIEETDAQLVKWIHIQLSEKLTTEKYTGTQITWWSPQVTAWQVLNGDDVQIEKKKLDSSLTCHQIPRRASRLWVPSRDKSLIMYTDLNPVCIIRKNFPLLLVSTCIHPILSLKFLSFSVFAVLCFL